MNKVALWHQAKSAYSYAYDEKTLHLTLRTARNDIDHVFLIYGDPFEWIGPKNDVRWVHHMVEVDKRYQQSDFDYYVAAIQPPFLRCKYIFVLKKGDKMFAFGSRRTFEIDNLKSFYETYNLADFHNYPYLHKDDLHHTPDWVKDTIWYQIFPDRFYGKDNKSELTWGKLPVHNHEIYGGNLKGVEAKLPYLKDMGITGIYFTPIFESPTAHKYDTKDYYKIDPQFGTNEDFKSMVDTAHRLGIKVMLDGVFNHAGYKHPFFQDVIEKGEHSIYKNAFFIKSYPVKNFDVDDRGIPKKPLNRQLNFHAFGFTPMMPKWNTTDPLAEAHLLGVITYWIEHYDIDGWRLDVSNEITHDFLRKIRTVSRKIKPDTFILGENWDASMPWLQGDQLDSVMNYELSYPIWQYLEHKISLISLKDLIINYLAQTPKNVMENMFNLVGCHDTVRIKRRLDDDPRRVKLAYLMMFTSAGAPNIYYGDEIGLTGNQDPDNRRCMPWDPKDHDLDFFDFTKRLIYLRNNHPSMKAYDFHFIDHDDFLIYQKKTSDETLLVIINNHPTSATYLVDDQLQGNYVDLETQASLKLYDKMNVKPYGYVILKRM